MSPEAGTLEEDAFDDLLDDDPDGALALLADMSRATDPRLRALARQLAARVMVDVARRGATSRRGVGRIVTAPMRDDAGDVDVDASLEAIVDARAGGAAPNIERLHTRRWARPGTALCLLVDRSGSMTGRPLATGAVTAAAVALRSPADFSVVSFARDAVVVKAQDRSRTVEVVVDAVLALRGYGTTDLAGALSAAGAQLARSSATRRIAVLLSDCRSTEPGDVVHAASFLDELVIVAPAGDDEAAVELAAATDAVMTTVTGPSDAANALARVLS